MSQTLETSTRPPLCARFTARLAVTAAVLLAKQTPRRIKTILTLTRRGATPASYTQALAARNDVIAVSVLCSGQYCLQRSLATTLLCRLRGSWPTWSAGVRTPPFAAHAWIEAENQRVGEPTETATYRTILTVPPLAPNTSPNVP